MTKHYSKSTGRSLLLGLMALALTVPGYAADRKIKVTGRYLNFPISMQQDRKHFSVGLKKQQLDAGVIRMTEGTPDYWVFMDVSRWKGKTLTLSYDGSQEALDKVVVSDEIKTDVPVYQEKMRPQYHFSTRRGWINDPNGLIYANGYYHLFYQHNPYEREWENMHWGHAVSRDMLHWEEWPDAIKPDTLGTIFSGTAVLDPNNTAGFNKKDKQALIAVYTANRDDAQRQAMAYSLDNGLTFAPYAGNPIVESHKKWQSHDTRDPKVFWYAPGKHWVMVLNERDGHSIYNSPDLKHWTFESHLTGFWECPELFQLPVDGNKQNMKWVMWGATGTYMTGDFDGKRFTPDGPKHFNMAGSGYAAQTFNAMPAGDDRVVKMTWARLDFGNAPFKGCMLLPQEQKLRQTPEGLRLYSYPIKEVDQLFTTVASGDNLSLDEANKMLAQVNGDDQLRLKIKFHLTYSTDAGLFYKDYRIVNYDMNGNFLNGHFYVPQEPGSMDLEADVFIDNGVVEVFIDGGAYSYSLRHENANAKDNMFRLYGNQTVISHLEIARGKSIW